MSASHKTSSAQVFRLMLYRRPMHPELFNLHARRTERHGDYEVESWITNYGHVVRFQYDDQLLSEVIVDRGDHLPEHGLVHAIPCIGEKDYERDADDAGIGYVTTIQTESLTENLYIATMREMEDFARETGAISHKFAAPNGTPCLTVVDTQKYRKEFHVQSYHMLGSNTTILRTQSIFEITEA
ncbi:DUF2617 family protein [Poriferisphaera sp. WC338]|uniref:DUF2617 family protein n=1 Tax=Poriferisphaera sp. WC338 TaxID=3425129 RepID=UPI003D815C11